MNMELHTAAKEGDLEKIKTILENETGDTKLTLLNDVDLDGKTPLHIASEEGHVDLVKYFVDVGAGLVRQSKSGDTALHFASRKGHLDVVHYLIGKGVDVNGRSCDGLTSSTGEGADVNEISRDGLTSSTGKGADVNEISRDGLTSSTGKGADVNEISRDGITLSTGKGADVNDTSCDGLTFSSYSSLDSDSTNFTLSTDSDRGHTPLYYASREGHLDVVKCLVNAGADVNSASYDTYYTPIYAAASKSHLGVIEYLISEGADIDIARYMGRTPLHVVSENGKLDIVKCLLNAGADVNKLSRYNKETPLHAASRNRHLDVVKYLISEGAATDKVDGNGYTPLYYSSKEGFLDVVECLVNTGANVNGRASVDAPLHAALRKGHLEIVKYLISEGAEPDKVDIIGCTPLYYASFGGHLDVVECLVNAGVKVRNTETGPYSGGTILHVAMKKGYLDVVKYLTSKGAEIEKVDEEGYTPLYYASQMGYLDVVKCLVDEGADVNKTCSNRRETALHVATKCDRLGVVQYLISEGAEIEKVDVKGYTPLYYASRNGYLAVVECLLSEGADANEIHSYSRTTALHAATENGHLDIVKYLISQKPDISKAANNGQTALHVAASLGHLDIVKYLVTHGEEINAEDDEKYTPLCSALKKGHQGIVEFLMTREADIGTSDDVRSAALCNASSMGNLDAVKYIMHKGVDLNRRDADNFTPLYTASRNGHLRLIEFLVNSGADVKQKSYEGRLSLHAASMKGHFDVVKYLISQGSDVNGYDNDGQTSLHAASEGGHLETTEYLIFHGADISKTDKNDYTPLHLASRQGRLDVVEYLVNTGADVNKASINGNGPLYSALVSKRLDIVRYLMIRGADVGSSDNIGTAAICLSIRKGYHDVIEYIIGKAEDLNRRDIIGNTPLYSASEKGLLDIVECLLEKGADVNTTSTNGDTPLHAAARTGNIRIVEHLSSKGAGLNMVDHHHSTPLYIASKAGHLDIVECLVDKGADVNTTSTNGGTPLHAAARTGHIRIVEHLSSKGAELNMVDHHHCTPLYIASEAGHLDIVECLMNAGADINTASHDEYTPLGIALHCNQQTVAMSLMSKEADIGNRADIMNTLLHNASSSGDKGTVEYIVRTCKVACLDAEDKDGVTPLYHASQSGHLDVVKCLVNAGVDVNKGANNGDAPIHIASYNCHLPIVKYLIGKGVEVNRRGYGGVTPLLAASYYGHLDVVKYLISKGADLAKGDIDGHTPLYFATHDGNLNLVEYLVDAGADVNNAANDDTPIHAASCAGHLNIVKYLIDRKAEVNNRGFHGRTPLCTASVHGHLDVVKYLITIGADLNAGDQDGYTPLYVALQEGHLKVVDSLVNAGADVTRRANDDDAPIHAASRKGYTEIMKDLIAKGAHMEARNKYGWTILHFATDNGHLKLLEYLLGNKAISATGNTESILDTGLQTSAGVTPLMLASRRGHVGCVRLLLDNKADVETGDTEGWTALHYAATSGNITVVKKLLDRKESMIKRGSLRGQSPLSVALTSSNAGIAKYLLDKDVSCINGCDSDGLTPVHHATISGLASIIEELLSRGADVNLQSHDGQTPLHLAIRLCHCKERNVKETLTLREIKEESDDDISTEEALIQYLLNQGSKIDIKDNDGFRPVQYAKDERIRQMVFRRNLTEEDVIAFRDLPMAAPTESHRKIDCEGGILYVDGCDVTMSIPPRNMQPGSCYDVSIGIATDPQPIPEREFLPGHGLDIVLPAQWPYSTDQPVTLTIPHAASVLKSSAGRHENIIWKERESSSVQRERSVDGWHTQCIIREKKTKLSIYETSDLKGNIQLWIPVKRHHADGKRMVCTPFLPTDMARGEDITLRVYIHDDIPYSVQKIQKEEENRLYRQVHPGRRFVLEPESGDLVLECNGVKEIISTSELFNQDKKLFSMPVTTEPNTRTQVINISISSTNGQAKTSMAFMALQTGFSTDIGSTAEEIYSGPNTELSKEVITAKITTDLYYHLGIALGLSYTTLDSIQFKIRQDKGAGSLEGGGRVTLNQKAVTAMIRHWRKLQDSVTKVDDHLREIWKSVSDSADVHPFSKHGRSAHKNISKLQENEPGETTEDVFTELRYEEPLLASSDHAHGAEFQISGERGHWEGRVHEKRVRTPSVRSDSLRSVSTMGIFLKHGSLILVHDEATGQHPVQKHKRNLSAFRHRLRAARSVLSIDEHHEHDEEPDSFAVEEHRKRDILAWIETAERPATVRPSDPSSKPRDDEEEMEGPTHPIYSPSPNLTQVQGIENREDLSEGTGVIRLEKHDIEVRIPSDEAYGAKNFAWMERAAEGKPATFRPKGPSSEPRDKEEEMPSGPFHPISPPSPEPPKQTQVQETENREDTSEDTSVIRPEKHGIEVRIPPDKAYHAKDVTVTVIDEVPSELVLKETEAIISVGLEMSPPDATFNSPVKVTMPHSGIFTKPEAAKIVIYYRTKATEEFTPIPSTDGTPRCVVRQRDLDLYIDHFSEIWIVAVITRLFIGKRVICTPCIPVSAPRNDEHVVFVRVKDENSGKGEMEGGYMAPIDGEQFLVKWSSGSLRITCPESTMKNEARTLQETEIRHLTEHRLMFIVDTRVTVDTRATDMTKVILNFILEQSTTKYLIVPMQLSGGYDPDCAAVTAGTHQVEQTSPSWHTQAVTDGDILNLSELLPPNLFYKLHVALGIDYSIAEGIKEKTTDVNIQYVHLLQKWKSKFPRTRKDLDEILHQAEAGGLAEKYYSNTIPARTTSPMLSANKSIEALGIDLTIIIGGIVTIIVVMIAIMIKNQYWF